MCGAIAGALTLSLAQEIRNHPPQVLYYLLSYNIGRIASYALVGALLGALGAGLAHAMHLGHSVLQTLAGVLLLGAGLYLGGWFPAFSRLEKAGVPLWRRIEPYGRRLLPVRTPVQALVFGMVWGWLPCGLVYVGLAWAATSGGAWRGAWVMACFGLGTLPAMAGAGLITGWLLAWVRRPAMRRMTALVIIVFALMTLWMLLMGSAPHVRIDPYILSHT